MTYATNDNSGSINAGDFAPMQVIVDRSQGSTVYYGRAGIGKGTSSPNWRIWREVTIGSVTTLEWPTDSQGAYNLVWDDRYSLFPPSDYYSSQSVIFDGLNDYVDCGVGVPLTSVTTFTLSWWMRVNLVPTPGNVLGVLAKFASSAQRVSARIPPSRDLQFHLSAGVANTFGAFTLTSDDAWHNYVVVFDGAGAANADRLKIYKDGIPQVLSFTGTIPAATSASIGGASFEIGRMNTEYMNGYMDEVSFWSNAMSGANAALIYGANARPSDLSLHPDFATLVSWWRMGEGSAFPLIPDAKGANNGSMVNMTAGSITSEVPTGV